MEIKRMDLGKTQTTKATYRFSSKDVWSNLHDLWHSVCIKHGDIIGEDRYPEHDIDTILCAFMRTIFIGTMAELYEWGSISRESWSAALELLYDSILSTWVVVSGNYAYKKCENRIFMRDYRSLSKPMQVFIKPKMREQREATIKLVESHAAGNTVLTEEVRQALYDYAASFIKLYDSM